MPTTKIQLRGISQVPSDRLSADGGCAESMNVIMRESETAPMVAPEDITAQGTSLAALSSAGIDVLYIHKTNEYTNYIGIKEYTENNTQVLYLVAYCPIPDNPTIVKIRSISSSYSIASITSIGNMLIYSLYFGYCGYALFKNNTYKDYGNTLPRPTVGFSTSQVNQSEIAYDKYATQSYTNAQAVNPGETVDAKMFWEYVMSLRPLEGTGQNPEEDAFYSAVMQAIWDDFSVLRNNLAIGGKFSAPVLVRYALRMYDGSYVNMSEPILLTGTSEHMFLTPLTANIGGIDLRGDSAFDEYSFVFKTTPANVFTATATIQFPNASDWTELISSVDIFISTDILVPALRTNFASTAEELDTTMSMSLLTPMGHDISIGFDISGEKEAFEAELLEKANFYKIASIPIDTFVTSPTYTETLTPKTQDDLVVLPRLEDGEAHTITGIGNLTSYNNRLITGEQIVNLSPGHSAPQALIHSTGNSATYYVQYIVRDPQGKIHKVNGYYGFSLTLGSARAFISYPDPACIGAIIYVESGGIKVEHHLTLKEHPRLNCAYGFWGLNLNIGTSVYSPQGGWFTQTWGGTIAGENPTYTCGNRLALSEVDNPFVFPIDQRKRFSARIITALPATVALSTNQSGPLPLYVFTEEGIWAMSITAEGGLSQAFVVSRDVPYGDIKQLDGAIIFISEQGVMLLSGQKVKNISQEMDGAPFVPTAGLISLVSK